MMGQTIPNDEVPIVKGTGGIIALSKQQVAEQLARPCIRCASCVTACPCGLLPLEMASRSKNGDFDGALKYGLMDCVSCGSCAYVCPSNIPLVQYFNYAKGALANKQRAQHKATETKRLAEQRIARLEQEKSLHPVRSGRDSCRCGAVCSRTGAECQQCSTCRFAAAMLA